MKLSTRSLNAILIVTFVAIGIAAYYISANAWWNHATIQ